jgi:hypothetical protein
VTVGRAAAELRLKATYLAVRTRNRLRRQVWDSLTPRTIDRHVRAQCTTWAERRPLALVQPGTGESRIDAAIHRASSELAVEYLCRYQGDCLLEPRYGYVVDRPLRLIYLSMPFSELSTQSEHDHLIGFPSILSLAMARLGRRPTIRQDQVISLRFYWEHNYFHFMTDVLPKLRLANENGIPKDVPVVVGTRLAMQPFFKAAFPGGTVDGHPVIVQDNEFIAASEVVFARPNTYSRDNAMFVADLLGAHRAAPGRRRILINRAKSRGRYIINLPELIPVLKRFDVEVVDTDTLSLSEQIDLFAATELIVAIHGAGLANMIFRRDAPCTVVEIFPPTENALYFTRLARALQFEYRALSGYPDGPVFDRRQPFLVDPAALEQTLRKEAAASRLYLRQSVAP